MSRNISGDACLSPKSMFRHLATNSGDACSPVMPWFADSITNGPCNYRACKIGVWGVVLRRLQNSDPRRSIGLPTNQCAVEQL